MKNLGLSFHHFGLAVQKVDRAVSFLQDLGYQIGTSTYDPLQNVNLMMGKHQSMPDVEIIYPADTAGPLDNMLKANPENIYHICYVTMNLEMSLEAMKVKHRVMMIAKPQPAILFGGDPVSFYKVQGFGIIEILERKVS
jgi:Glyoxalase/Bleomycin resistance protein/Dioxygenase superfamily